MRDGTQQPIPSALGRTSQAQPALRRAVKEPRLSPVRLATSRAARFAESVQSRYTGRISAGLRSNLIYQRPEYRWFFRQVLQRSSPALSLHLTLRFTSDHRVIDGQPADSRRDMRGPVATGLKRLPLALMSMREPPTTSPALGQDARAARMLMHGARTSATLPDPVYRRSMSAPEVPQALAGANPLALAFDPGMTRQMTARGKRISMARPAGRVGSASPVLHPVPRIVHRPQTVPEPVTAGQGAAPFGQGDMAGSDFPAGMSPIRTSDAPGWPGGNTTSNTSTSLAPHQVQRLADQVVQIIDDRVIARRERMGRI